MGGSKPAVLNLSPETFEQEARFGLAVKLYEMGRLTSGQAAVIGLARESNANFILVDERKARKIARSVYGLHVIGSARVLVEAKRGGLLDNVGAALQAMRDGGYWIGDSIVDAALNKRD